jgi:hypothetical protein
VEDQFRDAVKELGWKIPALASRQSMSEVLKNANRVPSASATSALELQYQVEKKSYSIFGLALSLDGLKNKVQHWRQHLNISSNWKVKTNLLQINYQNTAPIFDLPTFDLTFYKEIQAFNQTFTTHHHLTQGDKHEQ